METLLLEWKVERTLLIEWPGGQVTQTRVIRGITNDDPEPRIFVNERGDAFVGMYPPATATERQQQRKIESASASASAPEKESRMEVEPESQLEHQDKETEEKSSHGSSSGNGRKHGSEEAEMTLAETLELEVCFSSSVFSYPSLFLTVNRSYRTFTGSGASQG